MTLRNPVDALWDLSLKPVPPYALPRPDDPIPEGWTRVRDANAPHGLIDMSPEFAAAQRGMEAEYARKRPAAGPWIPVTARMPEEKQRVLICDAHGCLGVGYQRGGLWEVDGDELGCAPTRWAEIRSPE